MVERTEFPDGAPCWADATVPDLDEARRFYGDLFGWSFTDQGPDVGHYTLCLANDIPVAALAPKRPDSTSPPRWNTYLATRNLDAATRRLVQHNGELLVSPKEILDTGRMAHAVDPTGAEFCLWQGGVRPGFGLWREPGAVGWSELVTPEGATADTFYQAVFGYDQQVQIGGGDFDYSVWKAGGDQVCGRWQTLELPPQWVTYFAVPDTDEAVSKVSALSGHVERQPWDTPYGRMASLLDPWGTPFSILGPMEDI